MKGDLDMATNEIKNLGDPTTGKSAVSRDWVYNELNQPVAGLNIAGDIDKKTYGIKNLGDPTTGT